jgi:hypothetical protein
VAAASASAAGPPSVADRVRAYPDQFAGIEGSDLVWRDGTRMAISDGRGDKSFETMLDRPDIDDMFAEPYRPGPPDHRPAVNEDPGRVRHEPLFRKMYGDCRKGGVEAHLKKVAWMPSRHGGSVLFTNVNGAADRLEAVIRDLEKLPPDMTKYLVPSAGTLNCRVIAGTSRMSMHAYGAAIDISTRYTDYWLWAKAPKAGPIPYRNRIPYAIVEIFERHGFIWGGKWYHYDTMHFEYRPELLGR